MAAYSRIFHHITLDDVKQRHQDKIIAQKIKEEKEKEQEEYIRALIEEKKLWQHNWREDLLNETLANTTTGVFAYRTTATSGGESSVDAVDGAAEASYEALPGEASAFSNTAITSGGPGTGQSRGFNVGQDYLEFGGDSGAGYPRLASFKKVDSTNFTKVTITAIRGNGSNGGDAPEDSGDELVLWYQRGSDSMVEVGTIIPLGNDTSGLEDWSIDLPDGAKGENTQFILRQADHAGQDFDTYGVTAIKYHKTTVTPEIVFTSLDSEEATSFIRSEPTQSKTSAKKRKKKINTLLKGSRQYTDHTFGEKFPGSGARDVGEVEIDSFTPQAQPDLLSQARQAATTKIGSGTDGTVEPFAATPSTSQVPPASQDATISSLSPADKAKFEKSGQIPSPKEQAKFNSTYKPTKADPFGKPQDNSNAAFNAWSKALDAELMRQHKDLVTKAGYGWTLGTAGKNFQDSTYIAFSNYPPGTPEHALSQAITALWKSVMDARNAYGKQIGKGGEKELTWDELMARDAAKEDPYGTAWGGKDPTDTDAADTDDVDTDDADTDVDDTDVDAKGDQGDPWDTPDTDQPPTDEKGAKDILGNMAKGLMDKIKSLPGVDWAGDAINGIADGFSNLTNVMDTLKNAEKSGNIKDGKIVEGAKGSLSNPMINHVKNSTAEDIIKGVDFSKPLGIGSQIQQNVSQNPIEGNIGAKGIHNNLPGLGSNDDQYPSPYINDKGDLIIPDTFAFRPHGHEDNKLVQAISNIAGALGGDKEKVQNWAATKIDSSLGAFIPNIPGQDDPIVHFQTVIPKNQLTQIQNKFQQIADTAKR